MRYKIRVKATISGVDADENTIRRAVEVGLRELARRQHAEVRRLEVDVEER